MSTDLQWERVPQFRSYSLKSTASFCLEPGAMNNLQSLIPSGDRGLQEVFKGGRCLTMQDFKRDQKNLELDSEFDGKPV